MKKPLIIALSVAFMSPALAWENECEEDFERTIEFTEVVGADSNVYIDAEAGKLDVIGQSDLDQATVVGYACASSEDLLEEILLDAQSTSGGLRIESKTPKTRGGWRQQVAYIDVTVRLPSRAQLKIDDSSGSMRVSGVASLELDDSSGSVSVKSISGPVEITDSSGSLTVKDVDGDVTINDGSGSITVRSVEGSVRIEDDGSGSIDIRTVAQNVVVEDDGSGSIRVSDIGGDFSVHSDGSGGIRYNNVTGSVSIPKD